MRAHKETNEIVKTNQYKLNSFFLFNVKTFFNTFFEIFKELKVLKLFLILFLPKLEVLIPLIQIFI